VIGLLSLEHLVAVGVIASCVAALVIAARLRPGPWTVPACRALAALIIVNECGWWVWLGLQHTWSAAYALPFQLCDVVAFVSAAALLTRRQVLVELTYFWGLAGTANGLISPDVPVHFPHYLFLQYFIAHGTIVAAALLLVVGLRIAPRQGAVVRVTALTLALAAIDAGVNLVTGGNYMYLRHPPNVPTLLNLLGPWPWYIVTSTILAVGIFAVLNLPFYLGRRRPAKAA
jgi:hypothetical integral membrane protein (TIGR02206 family)